MKTSLLIIIILAAAALVVFVPIAIARSRNRGKERAIWSRHISAEAMRQAELEEVGKGDPSKFGWTGGCPHCDAVEDYIVPKTRPESPYTQGVRCKACGKWFKVF